MIQAALNTGDQDAYFFRGGQLIAYDMAKDTAPKGTQELLAVYPDLAGTVFAANLDAAVEWRQGGVDGSAIAKVYLFKGDQCAAYDPQGNQLIAGPVSITEMWPELGRVGFGGGFDDAFWYERKKTGELHSRSFVYFFKGDAYVRYDADSNTAESVKSIAANWTGLKDAGFDRDIDAVVGRRVREGFLGSDKKADYAYFFKGDKYLRYDLINDKTIGGPSTISGAWAALKGTDFAGAEAPTPTAKVARATYTVTFSNPGDDGGTPEPYGKIWLQTKDGTEFRLWTQRNVAGDAAPTRGRFTNAIDLPFGAEDIATVHANVDEDDTWNGDDYLARGSKPFTGDGTYTLTSDDGSVAIELTVA
ncbi:hemopexin repeat-containing protein [Streptomyces sp. NPDC059002]|uniref:hemopexin repeat-containing protein n=1 Tax=Streptomyces sp. NPDC059002 TaxID=3346690 RepID=UPI0036AE9940